MIASNPSSGGNDRGGRTKPRESVDRTVGSTLISGSGTGGFPYSISPAILLMIALVAYGTPLAYGAEPDYFHHLFDGATYRGWDCWALLEVSTDIDTCYTKAKARNCDGMETFWSCVYHKSCARCDSTGAIELFHTMQGNVQKDNCSTHVKQPAGGCLAKANTGDCFNKLQEVGSISNCKSGLNATGSTRKPKAKKCEEERAVSNCLMKEACQHCDNLAASAMAIEQEALLYEDGYCTQPNDSSSVKLHSCSYYNVSTNMSSNATKDYEHFMMCFETLTNDSDVKVCQAKGNDEFHIRDNEIASLNDSCAAADYSLHCINEASCKKCTYLGSYAVLDWYNKAIQRAGCHDAKRTDLQCQTNLTSPPTFGPTEKETTEKPERKSTTQASSSKTGLIIGLIMLVLIIIVCAIGGYFYWAGLSETNASDKKGDSSGTSAGGKGGPSTLAKATEGKSKVGSSVAGSKQGAPKSSLATKSNVGPVGSGVAGTKAPSAVKSKLGPAASGTSAAKVPSSAVKSKIGLAESGTGAKAASGVKSSVSSGIGPTASKAKQASKSNVAAVASKSKA